MRVRVFLFVVFLSMLNVTNAFANQGNVLGLMLNQQRAEHDLAYLAESKKLSKAAQAHAKDMERQNYFSHIGRNGSDFRQRIMDQNYDPCYAAENIAQGQTTAPQALKDWNDSKGHRENNLSPKPTEYGAGRDGDTWVLLFARPC